MANKPTHLRVAVTDEKPRMKVHENITEALEGSSRDVLAAMRKSLAKQIDAGEIAGNSVASAMRELRELDRLIRVADAELEAEGKRSGDSDHRRSFSSSAI